jgi:hypothetical protein
VQKVLIGVFLSLLGYICVMLTSINSKIDAIYTTGVQYAVLNEVKPQSYAGERVQDVTFKSPGPAQIAPQLVPANAGLMIAAMISIFISWHISRLYHSHQWTKTILRKTFTQYCEPYLIPTPPEPLHADQDCVGDPPREDGSIKESWLPPHAKELYAVWRRH